MKLLPAVFILYSLAAVSVIASPRAIQIDPQISSVQVMVSSTIDSFTARLEKFEAQIQWEDSSKVPSLTTVTFHFADLKTGNIDRDKAMLKWLESDSHPIGRFQLTGWKQGGSTNCALGSLELHGVTREIVSPLRISQTGPLWEIDGTAELDYRDFGLAKIRKAFVLTVNPHLKVVYHLAGKWPTAP